MKKTPTKLLLSIKPSGRKKSFGIFIAGAMSASQLSAAVYAVSNITTTNGWNQASVWEDNNVPTAGEDYIIQGYDVTANRNGDSTFAGGSLRVNSGGILSIRGSVP